ncbi:MAG: hypothetical protein IPM25_05850 [Chloracidobacterium sp.]|nr:hypothetical protein [Chloracidobacterium sp.]
MNTSIQTRRLSGSIVIMLAAIISAACSDNVSGSGLEFGDKTITVRSGGDLQAAIDRAAPGDTILLEAGATFAGSFKLPNKPGNEFITIRSNAPDKDLPADGERIDPKKHSSRLPKLVSNVRGEPALLAVDGAHHFRFVAVEFGPTIGGLYDIIKLGTGQERSVAELPHHIEFDRVWIHGHPDEGQRRGIAANGRHIRIVDSYISDIKREGDESQGVAVWATDGPVEIVNNYIEAAAENILFGGAGSFLKLVPTDCLVDSNHLSKPIAWKGADWVVKNLFEIKNGRRIKVTNNLMTNNWAMGQDGFGILFTTRADNGNATVIEDIEFTGNIVRGSGGGLNILGNEGAGGHRLNIRNNIFDDIDGKKWGGAGHFMKVTDWNGLMFESNTIIHSGNITVAYDKPVRGFVFKNNIVQENEYGFFGDGLGSGLPALDKYFPGGTLTGNLIVGGEKETYREPNLFARTLDEVGFRDRANGDLRLRPGGRFAPSVGANLDPATVGRK